MGDFPCPPYPNNRLETRIISQKKLPKICLVASASKHFSDKALKCITKVKKSVHTSGAAGDVVLFLATTAVLEVVRRLSKGRCPFIWRGLQALQILCYPPFKWIQKWAPLKALAKQLQKLSRPMLLLSIATVFSDQSSSTGETTPNDHPDAQAFSVSQLNASPEQGGPLARSPDEEKWLQELHKELRKEGISVPERLNDNELRQFYIATKGDFVRLLSSVKKTIKWRQSYTILSPQELEGFSHIIFWHGHDANQQPCLIIRLGLACTYFRSNDKSVFIKAVVSQIEHGILSLAGAEHPQITVLMDCEGISPLGFPIHMMRSCAVLLQDHYPNRLSSLLIVRLPPVAQIIMQTFFQVLKPATRKKVRIIGRNHLEFLSKHLDAIPLFLGGNCSCSKCLNREGKSDEVAFTKATPPDHASKSDAVTSMGPANDHLDKSDDTRTEPRPDHVNGRTLVDHHYGSSTNGCREELRKIIAIGLMMVWIFIVVILGLLYPERLPRLHWPSACYAFQGY